MKKLFLHLWVTQCPTQPGVIQEFPQKQKAVPVESLMLFSPRGESCQLTHWIQRNTKFMPSHFPLRQQAAGMTAAASLVPVVFRSQHSINL